MAYRAAGENTGDMSRDTLFANDSAASGSKRRGICAPCIWFSSAPLSRWQFAVMLLFGLLTPLWVVLRLTGPLTGDITAGAAAVVLAVYGANHFRILLGLKEQVDKFSKSNDAFKTENKQLKTEVSKLTKAAEELTAISRRLNETTKSYEENISKFRALDDKLGQLADDNIEGLERLKEMTGKVQDTIEKEFIQHARDILMRVQESMEFGDDKEGLNQDEWNRFVSALPKKVQIAFAQVNFNDISGDDNTMDLQEFTKFVDDTVTKEAMNRFTNLKQT